MSKPKEFWISKGSSSFCDELTFDDDGNDCKHTPDEFYDLVSPNDTIEGAIHVIEKQAYDLAVTRIDELLTLVEKLTNMISTGQGRNDMLSEINKCIGAKK